MRFFNATLVTVMSRSGLSGMARVKNINKHSKMQKNYIYLYFRDGFNCD